MEKTKSPNLNKKMLKSIDVSSKVSLNDPMDIKRRNYYRDVALSIDFSKID